MVDMNNINHNLDNSPLLKYAQHEKEFVLDSLDNNNDFNLKKLYSFRRTK